MYLEILGITKGIDRGLLERRGHCGSHTGEKPLNVDRNTVNIQRLPLVE